MAAAFAAVAFSATASSEPLTGFAGGSSFSPRVPVSALAAPLSGFDPTRLHFSTSVIVGSGFGRGTQGLQVTSLSYRFGAPLWMGVSVGSAIGPSASRSGRSFFLEGLDVGYRPHPSMLIEVHYRDLRSPLQLSNSPGLFAP